MDSVINKINIKGITYNIGGSLETIEWSPTSDLNNLISTGEYEIKGKRQQDYKDNMPIINGGEFHAFLKVYSNSDTSYISQIITLDNLAGCDTNTYIRNKQNEAWSNWSKQQGNVEVGAIGEGCEKTFNDLTESGIYSGINITKSGYNYYQETFVLIVINDILYKGGATQLKYSLDTTGGTRTIKLQKRLGYHTDSGIAWTNWEHIVESELTYILDSIKYVKKFQNSFETTSSISLYRYNYYRFKNDSANMYISLLDENNDTEDTVVDTYEFEFHVNSGISTPTVTFNRTIKWANNTPPPYIPGKIYQINIQNGLGVWAEFDQ